MVPVSKLKRHEETDPQKTSALLGELQSHPVLKYPILVDEKTFVILDGHHRFALFEQLGFRKIPCLLVDYDSPEIELNANEEGVSKREVIQRALAGKPFPPKTTRHSLRSDWALTECSLPLPMGGRFGFQ